MDIVYLLHYRNKLGRSHHYIGYTTHDHFERRMKAHRTGVGSKITRELGKINDHFHVAKIWIGKGLEFERKLKNAGNHKRGCPICRKEVEEHECGIYLCDVVEEDDLPWRVEFEEERSLGGL